MEFPTQGQAETYTTMLESVDIEWYSIIERCATSTPANKRSEMVAAGRKAYTKSFTNGDIVDVILNGDDDMDPYKF